MKIGIIGGGPAGISCGIQLKRFGLNPSIFEKNEIGGTVNEAYKIFNLLGFSEGIEGKKFVKKIKEAVYRHKLKVIFKEVKSLNYLKNKFILNENKIFDILIIASGTYPNDYNNFNDFDIIHKVKNKKNSTIGIVGGSDVAFDYALTLKKSGKVFILHKSEKPRAIKHLQKIVFSYKNIHYLNNFKIYKIKKVDKKIKIYFKKDGEEGFLFFDFLLNATGRIPEKRFYSENFGKKEEELKKKGLLYLIGDVLHPEYRQISISEGDGILTAQKIYEKIKKWKY